MTRDIRWSPIFRTIDGKRVLFVLPDVPDDAPTPLKQAIARRRTASIDGTCPCGGRRAGLNRATRRANRGDGTAHLQFHHDPTCDATDDHLTALLQDWRNQP